MKSRFSKKKSASSDAIPLSLSLDTTPLKTPTEPNSPIKPPALVNKRILIISLWGIANAILIGFVAKALIILIDIITNFAFFGRFSLEPAAPTGNTLGLLVIIVPVVGGLIVGLMARYGSTSIRGHGIPEAMEQVLTNKSRISPITAFLKPLSSAISIGTGGPFGAEGPIIATGGAFGSLAGQFGRVTATERKILLTAGACAGMATIFGSPLAAILLAIELLLFEFSPRSIIPVALSCIIGAALHLLLFGSEAVFAMPPIPEPTEVASLAYLGLGIIIGIVAVLISKSVYLVEDLFEKLPIHWMWWPAIGAVVVGVVGYIDPHTMGVGYTNISNLLTGTLPVGAILMLGLLKYISWVFSLGSGTSGGTLAPLFTVGGSLGALLGAAVLQIFPDSGVNIPTAALVGMAATFAGASRALLTSIVFALETTGQMHGLIPVLGSSTAAYFVSFFLMKGSIMTEKIERRGVRTPNSYQPDALQLLAARTAIYADENRILHAGIAVGEVCEQFTLGTEVSPSDNFVVVDHEEKLLGIVYREDIIRHVEDRVTEAPIESLIRATSTFVYPETPLSLAVDSMARNRAQILPVIASSRDKQLLGVLSNHSILSAYQQHHTSAEREYDRTFAFKRRGMRMYVQAVHNRSNKARHN